MELYLLRHGTAHSGRPGISDSARELTPEGALDVERVAERARAARRVRRGHTLLPDNRMVRPEYQRLHQGRVLRQSVDRQIPLDGTRLEHPLLGRFDGRQDGRSALASDSAKTRFAQGERKSTAVASALTRAATPMPPGASLPRTLKTRTPAMTAESPRPKGSPLKTLTAV